MIDNYEFVYSLLFEGRIFYIGRCKNTIARYQAHISTARSAKTRTARFISTILDKGQFPFLKIIDYLPKEEAAKLEPALVTSISNGGQILTNCSYVYDNRWYTRWPKNMPLEPNRRQMLTIIKYLQDYQIHWCHFREGRRYYSSPDQPFEQ